MLDASAGLVVRCLPPTQPARWDEGQWVCSRWSPGFTRRLSRTLERGLHVKGWFGSWLPNCPGPEGASCLYGPSSGSLRLSLAHGSRSRVVVGLAVCPAASAGGDPHFKAGPRLRLPAARNPAVPTGLRWPTCPMASRSEQDRRRTRQHSPDCRSSSQCPGGGDALPHARGRSSCGRRGRPPDWIALRTRSTAP